MATTTNTKIKDIWKCDSCEISSNTKGRMIPCPRGGCDALIVGKTTIVTVKVTEMFNEEQIEKANK